MTQYLIRTLTDSTGHTFTHVTKARENETFTVVKAESKAEAERMVNEPRMLANRGLGTTIKHERFTKEEKETLFGKDYKKGQWQMRILKTLLIIAVYELSKYVTNEIIIKLQANDDIDQYPMDYEVSEWT